MGTADAAALTVAVAQPRTVPHDLAANAAEHARSIREAGARLVVFPELSLTGYELDTAAVPLDHPALDTIRDACRESDAIALVGAVVAEGGRDRIAVLRIDAHGVDVPYRKVWLHGAEGERFAPGAAPGVIEVDGWRVGLGICRDTKVAAHIDALASERLDLYAAGVLDVPSERAERAACSAGIAERLGVPVAIAGYADATTLYPQTAGASAITAPDGRVLASASPAVGDLAVVELRQA